MISTFSTEQEAKDYYIKLLNSSPDNIKINDNYLLSLTSFIPDHETYKLVYSVGVDYVYANKLNINTRSFFMKLFNDADIAFDFNECVENRFNSIRRTL